MVHGDYTLDSGPRRLRDLATAPTGNDTYRTALAEGCSLLDGSDVARALEDGRFAIINLWRNIAPEPVAREPLALCDATSVDPDDLAVFEVFYSDRVGENYLAKHAERHRWCYYPALTREEALLIKQWDSHSQRRCASLRCGTTARSGSRQGFCHSQTAVETVQSSGM